MDVILVNKGGLEREKEKKEEKEKEEDVSKKEEKIEELKSLLTETKSLPSKLLMLWTALGVIKKVKSLEEALESTDGEK
jgi:hypothetical protein